MKVMSNINKKKREQHYRRLLFQSEEVRGLRTCGEENGEKEGKEKPTVKIFGDIVMKLEAAVPGGISNKCLKYGGEEFKNWLSKLI